ncbi:MAG: amidase [Pseudomonadota bacterium]
MTVEIDIPLVFTVPDETSPDPLGAFMAHAPYSTAGYAPAPQSQLLSGLSVGIKDLYDVAGLKTGAGSPAWFAQAKPAQRSAPAVVALLDAGAQFVGKTLTDELAWSLNGENVHYGTPVNVAAPGRIPGGSSAGSAAAVTGGLCDLALGSDTGGSVRAPASYCGVWGIRPTHGRISLSGAVALAPSYDTAGWFARDARVLALAGQALLNADNAVPLTPERLLVAEELFERLDAPLRAPLLEKVRVLARRLGLVPEFVTLSATDERVGDVAAWRQAFITTQSAEVWDVHGDWVEREKPQFGPGVGERFLAAQSLPADDIAEARGKRTAVADHVRGFLGDASLLVVPGAAGVAPHKNLDPETLQEIRMRALDILCVAGMAGLPQLAIPALKTPEGPVGLGLIGPAGTDEVLLNLAQELEEL